MKSNAFFVMMIEKGKGGRIGLRKKIYTFFLILCTITFLFCAWKLGQYLFAYHQADQEYQEIRKVGNTGNDRKEIDFDGLRKMNSDTIGWIYMEGTEIDYPIVISHDNNEYLSRTFQGTSNRSGAIFMDKNCDKEFASDNSVIYGHHMRDGSMFADLLKFREQSFINEENDVILYTPERTIPLKVIASYAAKGSTKIPIMFSDEGEKEDYIAEILKKSDVSAGVSEADRKKIGKLYTFITCSYEEEDNRTFVYAVESDDIS